MGEGVKGIGSMEDRDNPDNRDSVGMCLDIYLGWLELLTGSCRGIEKAQRSGRIERVTPDRLKDRARLANEAGIVAIANTQFLSESS